MADMKEEVNIKVKRENKERKCELEGGEREGGSTEEKKGRGYRGKDAGLYHIDFWCKD